MRPKRKFTKLFVLLLTATFLCQNIGLAEIAYDRGASCLKPPTTFSPDEIAKELREEPMKYACIALLRGIIKTQYEKGIPQAEAFEELKFYILENSNRFAKIESLARGYLFKVTLHNDLGGGTYIIGYDAQKKPIFEDNQAFLDSVRFYRYSDLPEALKTDELYGLIQDMHYEISVGLRRRRSSGDIRKEFDREWEGQHNDAMIAFSGNRPIAIYGFGRAKEERLCWSQGNYTHRDYRRRGVGNKIKDALFGYLKEEGMEKFAIGNPIFPGSGPILPLETAQGFHEDFINENPDAIVKGSILRTEDGRLVKFTVDLAKYIPETARTTVEAAGPARKGDAASGPKTASPEFAARPETAGSEAALARKALLQTREWRSFTAEQCEGCSVDLARRLRKLGIEARVMSNTKMPHWHVEARLDGTDYVLDAHPEGMGGSWTDAAGEEGFVFLRKDAPLADAETAKRLYSGEEDKELTDEAVYYAGHDLEFLKRQQGLARQVWSARWNQGHRPETEDYMAALDHFLDETDRMIAGLETGPASASSEYAEKAAEAIEPKPFKDEEVQLFGHMLKIAGLEGFARELLESRTRPQWGRAEVEGEERAAKNTRQSDGTYELEFNARFREVFRGLLDELPNREKQFLCRDYILKMPRILGHELAEIFAERYLLDVERMHPERDRERLIVLEEACGFLSELLIYRGLRRALEPRGWYSAKSRDMADRFNRRIGAAAEHLQGLRGIMGLSETKDDTRIGDLRDEVTGIRSDSYLGGLLQEMLSGQEMRQLSEEEFEIVRRIMKDVIAASDIPLADADLEQADEGADRLIRDAKVISLHREANRHFEAGEYGAAEEKLQQALKFEEKKAGTLTNLARVYVEIGQLDRAIECAGDAMKIDPDSPYPYAHKAKAHRFKGEFEEGARTCRGRLNSKPDDYGLWFELAQNLIGLGDPKGAERAILKIPFGRRSISAKDVLREARRLLASEGGSEKDYVKGLCTQANRLMLEKREEEAEKLLLEARGVDPEDLHTLGNLARLYLSMNRYEDALECAGEMLKLRPHDTKNLPAYTNYANALTGLGRSAEARAALKKGLKIDPENTYLLLQDAEAATLLGEYDDAIVNCHKALEAKPKDKEPIIKVLAKAQRLKGEPALARQILWTALKENPHSIYLLSEDADAAIALGEHSEAIAITLKMSKTAPHIAIAFQLRAKARRLQGKIDASVDTCLVGLEHNPQDPVLLVRLAEGLTDLGEFQKAREALDAASAQRCDAYARGEIAQAQNYYARKSGEGIEAPEAKHVSPPGPTTASTEWSEGKPAGGTAKSLKRQLWGFMAEMKYKEAAECAKRVLELAPGDSDVLSKVPSISSGLRSDGMFYEAKDLLSAVFTEGPDALPKGAGETNIASLLREMTMVLEVLGDDVKAARYQEHLIGLLPEGDRAFKAVTRISRKLRDEGKFLAAKGLLEAGLRREPGNIYFLSEMTLVLIGLGDYASAAECEGKRMDVEGAEYARRGIIAEIEEGLREQGKISEAEEFARRFRTREQRHSRYFRDGIDDALAASDYVKAAGYAEGLLNAYPELDAAYKLAARISHGLRGIEQHRLAASLCEAGLSHRPEDVVLRTELARSYAAIGEHEKAIEQAREVMRLKLDDDRHWMLLSIVLRLAGRFEEAFETGEEGLSRFPGNPYLLKEIIETCIAWERYDLALPYTESLVAVQKKDERSYALCAKVLHFLGRIRQAQGVCRLGLVRVPNSPILYAELAENCIYREDYGGAVENGKKAAGLAKGEPEVLRRISHLAAELRKKGRPQEGVELCEAGLAEDSSLPSLITEMLNCRIALGDYLNAAEFAKKILETGIPHPSIYPTFSIISKGLMEGGHIAKAKALLEASLAKDPRNSFFHAELAGCYISTRNYSKAVEHAQRAVEYNPENLRAWTLLSRAWRGKRDFKKALSICNGVLARHPQDVHLLIESAECNIRLGEVAEGERQVREALRLNPDDNASYTVLSFALRRQERYDEALEVCRQGLERKGAVSQLYSEISKGLIGKGDYSGALEAIEKAVKADEQNPQPHLIRALCLSAIGEENKGRLQEAERSLKIYLTEHPRSDTGTALREWIERRLAGGIAEEPQAPKLAQLARVIATSSEELGATTASEKGEGLTQASSKAKYKVTVEREIASSKGMHTRNSASLALTAGRIKDLLKDADIELSWTEEGRRNTVTNPTSVEHLAPLYRPISPDIYRGSVQVSVEGPYDKVALEKAAQTLGKIIGDPDFRDGFLPDTEKDGGRSGRDLAEEIWSDLDELARAVSAESLGRGEWDASMRGRRFAAGPTTASPEWDEGLASPEDGYRANLEDAVRETKEAMLKAAVDTGREQMCHDYAFYLRDALQRQGISSAVRKAYFISPMWHGIVAHFWVETEGGWIIDAHPSLNPLMEFSEFARTLQGRDRIIEGPAEFRFRPYYSMSVSTNINPSSELKPHKKAKVMIPAELSGLTGGQTEFEFEPGSSIKGILEELTERFEGLDEALSEQMKVEDNFLIDADLTPGEVIPDTPVQAELAIVPLIDAEVFGKVVQAVQSLRGIAQAAGERGQELVVAIDTDIANLEEYAQELFKALAEVGGRRGLENLAIITGRGRDPEFIKKVNGSLAGAREERRAIAIARDSNVESGAFAGLNSEFQLISVVDNDFMDGERLLCHVEISEFTGIIERALADRSLAEWILTVPDDVLRPATGDEIRRRYKEEARYLRSA